MKTFFQIIISLCIMTIPLMAQIESGTSVQITITGVPPEEKAKFDGPYAVFDSGTINLPHIGKMRAAGLSPETLAVAIQDAYKKAEIFTSPTIQVVSTVEGSGVREQLVVVGGSVRNPGPVKYNNNLTLYQAIQNAGGKTEFGTLKRVILFRAGKPKIYDVDAPAGKNIRLQPDDTIEVPAKNLFGK